MDVQTFLTGLISGAVAVPLITNLFTLNLVKTTEFNKNVAGFVLPFILAIVGYLGLIKLGYSPMPVDMQQWAGELVPVLTSAYATSQAIWKFFGKSALYIRLVGRA